MAKRIEPSRKSPLERLDDLFRGVDEVGYEPAARAKYVSRVLEASNSLPNAVKFFANALLTEASASLGTADGEEAALEALSEAERNLPAARDEMPREILKRLPGLAFLEKAVAIRADRGEFDEALRLCDLALELGGGKGFEARRRSLERLV